MRNLGRIIIAAGLLCLLASCGWSAVEIRWVDALGLHKQELQNVPNPNYSTLGVGQEQEYVWAGTVDVTMPRPDDPYAPAVFTVTGNFVGARGLIWSEVRLEQHVTNQTPGSPANWSSLGIQARDGTRIFTVFRIEPNWNWSSSPSYAELSAAASANYILPGQVLDFGVNLWANVEPNNGNGHLKFHQRLTYVP